MQNRDLTLDAAKGLCILLVVMGHMLQYNTVEGMDQPLFNFIYSFHMPAFMLLSGCVAAFGRQKIVVGTSCAFVRKKAQQLALPFFVWGVIIMPLLVERIPIKDLPQTFLVLLQNPASGAWFLISLFCIQLMFLLFCLVSNLNKKHRPIVGDLMAAGVLIIIYAAMSLSLSEIGGGKILSAYLAPQYVVSFFAGYFFYRYCRRWLSFVYVYAVFLLIFIILVPMFEFNKTSFIIRMPIALSASFVIIGLSANIAQYTGPAALTAKLLIFLGRNSLIIYLVHFLFVMGSELQVETGSLSSITLFCILLLIAVMISLLCIGVSKVLSPSKFLSRLVFGK